MALLSRPLLLILAIVLVAACLVAYKRHRMPGTQNPSLVMLPTKPDEYVPPETSLLFVGDIMLARNVKNAVNKYHGGDFNALFAHVPEIAKADIAFANLEGPASDKGEDLHHLYSFRFATSSLLSLKNAGFDAFSVANNHVGDWGRAAFADSYTRVSAEFTAVGGGLTRAEAEEPKIIEKNGTRFGFLGFTDVGPDWLEATGTSPGILLASDPRLGEIIASAAKKVDVLITSFHWGIEYQPLSSARQKAIAHTAIDAGAKLVIGHHPHVAEETERYQGGFIAYSLGNFIFDQYFSEETMRGLGIEVKMKGNDISKIIAHTYRINTKNQPAEIESRIIEPF